MTTLTVYDGRFARLKEERDNIIKAKEALELAEPGTPLLSPLSLPFSLPLSLSLLPHSSYVHKREKL